MIEKKYIVINEAGVHARPATTLVTTASKFKCQISLTFKNNSVDLKSIIGVMSLGVYNQELISITCSGVDEIEASECLNTLLKESKLAKEL